MSDALSTVGTGRSLHHGRCALSVSFSEGRLYASLAAISLVVPGRIYTAP